MKKMLLGLSFVFIIGLALPCNVSMPVENAVTADYHPQSFWYYPWGKSVTHKGVDIFAKEGTNVHPASGGLVVYSGSLSMGGEVILILSSKWRLYYYAHLSERNTSSWHWVNKTDLIGRVGSTGNAIGKPPHLHFSIITLIPYPWRIDNSHQGWKKMFFLNPISYFN